MQFIAAGQIADFPAGRGRAVVLQGCQLAVFNVDGHLFAIENRCPHQGAPLHDGELSGHTVSCRWHGWQLDVRTGDAPCGGPPSVRSYPVRVIGETVWVGFEALLGPRGT